MQHKTWIYVTFYVVNGEFKRMWKEVVMAYLTQYPSICLEWQIKIMKSFNNDINPTRMSKYKDSYITFFFFNFQFYSTGSSTDRSPFENAKLKYFGCNKTCTQRSVWMRLIFFAPQPPGGGQIHKNLIYYLSRAMQTLIMFCQPPHQLCEIKITKNTIRLTWVLSKANLHLTTLQ